MLFRCQSLIPSAHRCLSPLGRCGGARRGAILLMVMGLIVLAAFAVERFLESALRQMRAEASAAPALDLRLAANSGLQLALAAIAELNELDGGLYGPLQGWADPVRYAAEADFGDGVSVRVAVSDEGGRIGLNPPDRSQLLLLLEQMDVSQWQHDALVDSLLDWVDTDEDPRASGAEDDDYIRMGSARLPPNEPLRSYEEFRYIKGWAELLFDSEGRPNANYTLLVASTSLRQSGGNRINLNSAPPAVRYLLAEQAGLEANRLTEYIAGDDRLSGTDDDRILRNAGELGLAGITVPEATGFAPGLLRVTVEAARGASRLTLTALLSPSTGSGVGVGGSGLGQGAGGGAGNAGGAGGAGSGTGAGGSDNAGGAGGANSGGGAQGSGLGGGQGSGSGGGSGSGALAGGSAAQLGTLGGFTLVEYAENMIIE